MAATPTITTRTVGSVEEHRVEHEGCGFTSRWEQDRVTVQGWADMHDEAACAAERRDQELRSREWAPADYDDVDDWD